MILRLLLSSLILMANYDAVASIQVGQICHAEPSQSKYRYAGVWSFDLQGHWTCNYRQFLSEEEWQYSLIEIDGQLPAENDDNELEIIIDEDDLMKGKRLREEGARANRSRGGAGLPERACKRAKGLLIDFMEYPLKVHLYFVNTTHEYDHYCSQNYS